MEEKRRKLLHAHHVLRHVDNYLGENPTEKSVRIAIDEDDVVRMHPVVLAAVCPWLKGALREEDVVVIVRGARVSAKDVDVFQKFLFGVSKAENARDEDLAALRRFSEAFAVNVIDFDFDGHDSGVSSSSFLVNDEEDALPKRRSRRKNKLGNYLTCEFCPRSFRYMSGLNIHLIMKHGKDEASEDEEDEEEEDEYACEKCGEQFLSRSGRESHMQTEHDQEIDIDEDEIPLRRSKRKKRLKKRRPRHSHHDPGPARLFAGHAATRYPVQEVRCVHCDAKLIGIKALRHHVSLEHPGRDLECLMCGEEAESKKRLFQHIQSHAKDPLNIFFACKFCGVNFSVRYDLRSHIRRTHLKESDEDLEPISSSTTRTTTSNKRRRRLATLTCPHCDKRFKGEIALDRHIRSHPGTRPFVCETCGRAFPTCDAFDAHKGCGNGDDDFGCSLCDKSFEGKRELLRHLRCEQHRENEARQAVREIILANQVQEVEIEDEDVENAVFVS